MLMTTLTRECPEPGVYEGVSFDEYNSWQSLSNSGMSLLAKSPRHYQEGERSEATDAQRIGELCHCNAFEPSAFAERYVIMPPFERDPENVTGNGEPSTSKATKYYRAKKAEFEAANTGREICPSEWYEQSISLVRELALNEEANRILSCTGPVEVSLVWDEPPRIEGADGDGLPIRCKARIDKFCPSLGTFADLKKCRDVTQFGRDIAYRNYHRQMAFYQAGLAALHGGELFTPWLIAHEISAPLSVLAAPLSEIAIIEGTEQVERLLAIYCQCRAADSWPGLTNPTEWSLPEWAISPVTMFAGDGEKVEI